MKLFYMPGACSLAPHIVLEWIGKPLELGRVERGKTHEPDSSGEPSRKTFFVARATRSQNPSLTIPICINFSCKWQKMKGYNEPCDRKTLPFGHPQLMGVKVVY